MSDFWRGERVLLTGHTGLKGAWTALWLEQLGADVTGFALAPPQDRDCVFSCVAPWTKLTSTIGDLRDPSGSAAPQQHSAPSAEPTRSMQPAGPDSEATTAIPVQRANGTQGGPDEPPTRAIPVFFLTRTGTTETATKRVNARGESTRGEGSEDNPRRGESVSAQDLLRREGRL